MSHAPYTLAVGLNVAEHEGKIAWGLVSNGDHVLTGIVDTPNLTVEDAFCAGFSALVEGEDYAETLIDLYCGSERLCTALLGMADAWPHITVHPWTEDTTRGFLVRTAGRAAFKAIRDSIPIPVDLTKHPKVQAKDDADLHLDPEPAPARPAPPPLPRVYAATDGSSGFHSGGKSRRVSGWGWVTATGTYKYGTINTNLIEVAELAAICDLINSVDRNVPLTVYTDSTHALHVIQALRDGASFLGFTFPGAQKSHTLLRRIRDRVLDADNLEFHWVPGHSGHALNDAADRLAVQARRAHQNGVPAETLAHIASNIVEDLMTAQSDRPTAQSA